MLNSAETYLSQADKEIRGQVIEKLTGVSLTKWQPERALEYEVYEAWLHHVNFDLDQKYGMFFDGTNSSPLGRVLPTLVETTKRIKIFGKHYTSRSLHEGNSTIEYQIHGQNRFGFIKYAFRSSELPTNFLVVEPLTALNEEHSKNDPFQSHHYLHATTLYSKPGGIVVVDSQNLMGHSVLISNPPQHLGIPEETVTIVSLRNIVSAIQLLEGSKLRLIRYSKCSAPLEQSSLNTDSTED